MPEMTSLEANAAHSPLTDQEWKTLLLRLTTGRCTAFLGGESGFDGVPTRTELAREMAREFGYPLNEGVELARVAQYVATVHDRLTPKEWLTARLQSLSLADFGRQSAHRLLAGLPFHIFVTTAFDDCLLQALRKHPKDPKQELWRWNPKLREETSELPGGRVPSVANPLLLRVYGHTGNLESLAVTEDDYLDFLINTCREPALVPHFIERAFSSFSLLFFGYRLDDCEFRNLMRLMAEQFRSNDNRSHLSVQLIHIGEETSTEKQQQLTSLQDYLGRYVASGPVSIRACWMSGVDFLRELTRRWEATRV